MNDVMAGINLITEWNPEEGGFLSFVVVNGIVGMQRAGGNEAEYFTFLLERAEYLFSPQSFSIFVLLNRRSCTIQKKKRRKGAGWNNPFAQVIDRLIVVNGKWPK